MIPQMGNAPPLDLSFMMTPAAFQPQPYDATTNNSNNTTPSAPPQ
jgi:hypothetical protein